MKLNDKDIELINKAQKTMVYSQADILGLEKSEILELTDLLAGLIGYDERKDDIDSLGEQADSTISKLLLYLEKRGEM